MKNLLLATVAAVAFSAPAIATPVPTTIGDPIPAPAVLVLTGTPFVAPTGAGTVNYVTLENFGLNTIINSDPGQPDNSETFNYDAILITHGTGAINGAVFSGSFGITVVNRVNLSGLGTFAAFINAADFTASFGAFTTTFGLSNAGMGTVTYSQVSS